MDILSLPPELEDIILKSICKKSKYNLVHKQWSGIDHCKWTKLYGKFYCSVHENIREIETNYLYLNYV